MTKLIHILSVTERSIQKLKTTKLLDIFALSQNRLGASVWKINGPKMTKSVQFCSVTQRSTRKTETLVFLQILALS